MHFEEVELLAVYRYPKSTAISVNNFFLHMLSCAWQAFKYQSSLKLNKWQSNSEIQKWFFYGRKLFISSGINRCSKVASDTLSANFPVEAEGT